MCEIFFGWYSADSVCVLGADGVSGCDLAPVGFGLRVLFMLL